MPKTNASSATTSADAISIATFDSGTDEQQPEQREQDGVAGGQPGGHERQASDHLLLPASRGSAPTVSVSESLHAVAPGTYIAEICAGIARNTPGVVTLSR